MSTNPPQLPPANWYPDPEQRDMYRFWDGAQWTDARRPLQGPAPVPPPPTQATADATQVLHPAATSTLVQERPAGPAAPESPTAPSTRKNGLGRVAMWLAIAALVLGSIPFIGFVSWVIAVTAIALGIAALRRRFLGKGAAIAALVIAPIAVITGFTTAVNAAVGHPSTTPAAAPASAKAAAPVTSEPASAAKTTEAPVVEKTAPAPAKPKSSLPASERKFISIVKNAADKIENTSSSLKEAKYRSARDASACAALTDNEAHKWVGTVTDIGANGDGYGYISVKIADGITVQTWNNAFSDFGDDTLVKPSKPFFDRMTNLEEGDKVYFAGKFLSSDTSCLKGTNITKTFYGLTPQFLMRFSDIRKA